ncbi:MAG TPA: hypothetical protein VF209_00835 [Patescibacteria group bacterium]
MKKQQLIIAGVVVALLLIVGGGFAFMKMSGDKPAEQTQDEKKKKVSQPVNVIPVEERPYLRIVPVDGRNLDLVAEVIKKPADLLEYELEYQAGTLLQGAFGELELDSLPATTRILLGSCSAGGACTYHEDVKGGSLVTRYAGENEYALKQEWRYLENTARDTGVSSKDAKFQLEAPGLAQQRVIIVFNSPGYPEGLTGTPVSDPYSLETMGTLSGEGELTMRANEEGDLTIMGWDGSTWNEFETTVDGKEAKATVDLMKLYVVVKK